ncbi:MAG TPA: flavin reductase family protein [bacterium (Candidatus Stahlbacteria)]|nr:flavin reductase family protein [Candidatus Stahlbacteria bacterium]
MDSKALYKVSYGLYVISATKGDKFNGQIANTVFQITSEPPRIAVSINKKNFTHEFIRKSYAFAISVLSQDTPMSFIGHFGFKSGRNINKFANINYKIGNTNSPIVLDNTLAYMEVKVVKEIDVVTHTIFIGEIVEAEILKEGEPMTYAYYHEVKRGRAPKTAPTYIKRG